MVHFNSADSFCGHAEIILLCTRVHVHIHSCTPEQDQRRTTVFHMCISRSSWNEVFWGTGWWKEWMDQTMAWFKKNLRFSMLNCSKTFSPLEPSVISLGRTQFIVSLSLPPSLLRFPTTLGCCCSRAKATRLLQVEKWEIGRRRDWGEKRLMHTSCWSFETHCCTQRWAQTRSW